MGYLSTYHLYCQSLIFQRLLFIYLPNAISTKRFMLILKNKTTASNAKANAFCTTVKTPFIVFKSDDGILIFTQYEVINLALY